MRLDKVGSHALTAVQVVGKLALNFMRIGATRTAIYTMMDYEKKQITDTQNQLSNGYKERIQPHVRNNIKKFNVMKGGRP